MSISELSNLLIELQTNKRTLGTCSKFQDPDYLNKWSKDSEERDHEADTTRKEEKKIENMTPEQRENLYEELRRVMLFILDKKRRDPKGKSVFIKRDKGKWVTWGTGIPKDRDDVKRRGV